MNGYIKEAKFLKFMHHRVLEYHGDVIPVGHVVHHQNHINETI